MLSIIFKTLPEAMAANEKARVWVNDNLRAVLPHTARMEAGKIVAHKGS